MEIETPRTRLRCWQDTDRDAFAALHAHPEVMLDAGGPLNRQQSEEKFDRYVAVFDQYGFGRWVVETLEGEFLGYVGVMPSRPSHPLGPHSEIGWCGPHGGTVMPRRRQKQHYAMSSLAVE